MADCLTLGAYWKSRREALEECAHRLQRYLTTMASIHPVFDQWHYGFRGRRDPGRRLDSGSMEELIHLLRRGMNRRDSDGSVIEDLGYHVTLSNELPKPRLVILGIKCGLYADPALGLLNSVIFDLPPEIATSQATELNMRILMAHVRCWDSPWVVIFGDEDREKDAAPFDPSNPRIGKLAYIGASVGLPKALPSTAAVESIEGGFLIKTREVGS